MKTNGSKGITGLKTKASVTAPDLGINPQDCLAAEPGEPCTLGVLGATGDLTARKLI